MKKISILLSFLLTSCTANSVQTIPFTPEPNTVKAVSAHNFWSSSTVVLVFDEHGKQVAVTEGSSAVPANLLLSGLNTAALGTAVPLASTLFNPTVNTSLALPGAPPK